MPKCGNDRAPRRTGHPRAFAVAPKTHDGLVSFGPASPPAGGTTDSVIVLRLQIERTGEPLDRVCGGLTDAERNGAGWRWRGHIHLFERGLARLRPDHFVDRFITERFALDIRRVASAIASGSGDTT